MKFLTYLVIGLLTFSLVVEEALAKKKKRKKRRKKRMKMSKSWERPYGMAGCGLGSIVMGKRGSQIFASTTNGTSGSQIFGITTGTSNCVDTPMGKVALKIDDYVHVNKVAIASDMARGTGENLTVMAKILGCQDQKAFNDSMKNNFKTIFKSHTENVIDITDSVINTVLEDEKLNCKNITLS